MLIIKNKKAYHDYFIEDKFEAGLVLNGWEIKSIRQGKGQLKDSYIKIRDGEVFILGFHVTPMVFTSTHSKVDADRIKKLLLSRHEIDKLIGKVEQKGYSIVALNLHFKRGRAKLDIALAKGKQLHDKRQTLKDQDAKREATQQIKQLKRL